MSIFGGYSGGALNVARCESNFNPRAQNPSGASGVFQILPRTFAGTPYAGENIFDALTNVKAAWFIFQRDGYSWREWVCRP